MWRKLILGLLILLSVPILALGQGPYLVTPIVTKRASGLVMDVSAGTVMVGGNAVAVAATTVTVAGTGATCTRPAFSSCDIVYANNAGVVAATPTIATATASGNTLLAFVATSGGNVTVVAYPWQDPRSEPPDVTGAAITVPWSSVTAATGTETLANTTNATAFSCTNPAAAANCFGLSMGTATTTSNLLNLSDGAANTGTGFLLNIANGAAALSNSLQVTASAQTGSPTNNQINLVDLTGNTNTGSLVNINTVGTSTAKPLVVTAQGTANGISMSTAGALTPIGSGVIAPRLNDVTALAAAKTFANTTFTTTLSCTNPAGAADCVTFSIGSATGASNGLTLSEGAANTGTGALLNIANGATSSANSIKVVAAGQSGSPSNNQVSIIDVTGNTNTGSLVNINTVGASTAKPLQVTAQGTSNGVQMSTAGLLQKIGTGSIKADASTAPTDGYFFVGPENCSMALTTGTFAANPANSGGLSAPGLVRAASGNTVLQLTTTAAANTTDVVCEINVPSRLTSGKGVTITAIGYFFGYQTTALTSIGTAAVNSITYSAAGGAAAGTVAAIGGALTVTPGTSHSTPGATTTTGQCYSEKLAFGTPYAINVDTTRLAWENTFVQSGASATVMQICGTVVYYTNQLL